MRMLAAWLGVLLGPVAAGTNLAAQSAPLVFDAVSIKENKTVSQDGIISGATPGRFTVTNTPVASMIRYAYRLRDYQLIDVPAWASSTPYDVIATYPASTAARSE